MATHVRAGRRARWLWMTMLACTGCGSAAHGTRYESLRADLGRVSAEPSGEDATAFEGEAVLTRAALVRAVLARNPGIEAAREAFRAAVSRHEARGALPDPVLQYELAPLSIPGDTPFGQTVRLTQRLPWPGKLSLDAQAALAEAEAAREDYAAVRLRLALMASVLYDRYYALGRSLAINDEHDALVREIQATATAQYEAGRVAQQEPLQADLELAQVERQRIVLEADQRVVAAQLNGLLHRKPDAALPPPPAQLDGADAPSTSSEAQVAEALAGRPELRASAARIDGGRARVELADRQSYPDLGVMGTYTSMFRATEHQWMVGVSIELPIQVGARSAAVREAEASLASAQAAESALRDEIAVEVESARQRVQQTHAVVELFGQRLLPAAKAQIEAARAAYETGRGGFQALVDAERSLRSLELERQLAIAEHGQARAELERALGRIPGLDQGGTP